MPRSTASATKSKPKSKVGESKATKAPAKKAKAVEPDEKPVKRPRAGKSAGEELAVPAPRPIQAVVPKPAPVPAAPVIVEPRPAPAPAPSGEGSSPSAPTPRPVPSAQGGGSGASGSGQGGRPLYQHQQRPWQGGGGQQQYQQRHQYQDRGPGPRPFNPTNPNNQSQHMNQSNGPSNGNPNSNAGAALMNAPQGQGGGGYGNGGGGGGGGQGMAGLTANQKKRRRKKKKGGGDGFLPGGGGGGPSGGSGAGGGQQRYSPRLGVMPNDEELEREARELTEKFTPKEYAEAAKKAPNIADLQKTGIEELHKIADAEGVVDAHKFPRHELTFEILKRRAAQGGLMIGAGTLDIAPEGGYGFLRSPLFSYLPSPDDVYVSAAQIRRMGLRKGMELKGAVRAPKEGERFFSLLRVDEVNGGEPSRLRTLPLFEDLTPLHPEQRYVLETTPDEIEMRIVDLVAPIGRGQRGLIVAPPRTGKTVLLQKMTKAIAKNYPEVKIIVLLIDERPEEVTDFRRNTNPSVEVIASTFDEDAQRHVAVCEMVHEKSRRYVELGMHVVILLDSITRLARAYNAGTSHSGKIMSGGIDSNALQRPKKFFGNARAIENGGSLTILGTALVDTGSKADEVIFEEFKGTGNSELHLDRKLVDKRIWPAIDVAASGTRREELLLDPNELELTYRLRKVLADMNVVEAMELMKSRLKKCKTNAEFLMSMKMGA